VALQVAEKMIFQARNNQNRLSMQLEPRDLGKLNINMVVRHNQVTATIIAENPLAKEALEEQIGQLRDSLSQQGLNLERFDVSLSGDKRDAWNGQGRTRTNRSGVQNVGTGSGDESDLEIDAAQTRTNAQRGLVDRII
jgi:flagellar hook-length control protein FliK